VAKINVEHLEGDHKQRAGLAIRIAYSQALETLFALLCSAVQAPKCPLAWMLSYKNTELVELVNKINHRRTIYKKFKGYPTWEQLAALVHSYMGYEDKKIVWIQKGFGRLWSNCATEFVDVNISDEYNGAKHGLRIRPGGSQISIGMEEIPGVAAPPENMKIIGHSTYGNAYFKREKIGESSFNFRPRHVSRNWNPENLAIALLLLSMSINNVIGFLRIMAGDSSQDCSFKNPSTEGDFDEPWKQSVGVTDFNIDTLIRIEDIEIYSKEDVLQSYGGKHKTV